MEIQSIMALVAEDVAYAVTDYAGSLHGPRWQMFEMQQPRLAMGSQIGDEYVVIDYRGRCSTGIDDCQIDACYLGLGNHAWMGAKVFTEKQEAQQYMQQKLMQYYGMTPMFCQAFSDQPDAWI